MRRTAPRQPKALPLTSEDDLIARYFAPIAGPGGLDLRDDAALIPETPGWDQVVTADALVAGVHFFADDPPRAIARKGLAVNLSDLAAKGAVPQGFVLTLALPAGWTDSWLAEFALGLAEEASAYACPLLGGDTVRTPGPLTLSITALGSVRRGHMVLRTGARPGDRLYVTGSIGDAALGLRLRLGEERDFADLDGAARRHLLDRYLHPQPRLALVETLLRHASGAMDVSDGLVGDLCKMMRASAASAEVDLARVPLSDAAAALVSMAPELFAAAVTGGDDYEILASVPGEAASAFEADAGRAGVAVTSIGVVTSSGLAPSFRDADGQDVTFERGSFSHF